MPVTQPLIAEFSKRVELDSTDNDHSITASSFKFANSGTNGMPCSIDFHLRQGENEEFWSFIKNACAELNRQRRHSDIGIDHNVWGNNTRGGIDFLSLGEMLAVGTKILTGARTKNLISDTDFQTALQSMRENMAPTGPDQVPFIAL